VLALPVATLTAHTLASILDAQEASLVNRTTLSLGASVFQEITAEVEVIEVTVGEVCAKTKTGAKPNSNNKKRLTLFIILSLCLFVNGVFSTPLAVLFEIKLSLNCFFIFTSIIIHSVADRAFELD
jgi:hypothetical protein